MSPSLYLVLNNMLELHKHGLAYSTRAEVFEPLLGEAVSSVEQCLKYLGGVGLAYLKAGLACWSRT